MVSHVHTYLHTLPAHIMLTIVCMHVCMHACTCGHAHVCESCHIKIVLYVSEGTNGSLASVLFPTTAAAAELLTDGLQQKSVLSVLKGNTKPLTDENKESASAVSSDDEKDCHLMKNGVHSTGALDGSTDSSMATFPAAANPFLLPLAESSVSPMAYFPFGNSPLLGPSTVHTSMFNPSPLFSSPIQAMFPYGSTATAKHSSSPDRPVMTRQNESSEKVARRKTSRGSSTSMTATSVSITSPILAVPKPAALTTGRKKQRCRTNRVGDQSQQIMFLALCPKPRDILEIDAGHSVLWCW